MKVEGRKRHSPLPFYGTVFLCLSVPPDFYLSGDFTPFAQFQIHCECLFLFLAHLYVHICNFHFGLSHLWIQSRQEYTAVCAVHYLQARNCMHFLIKRFVAQLWAQVLRGSIGHFSFAYFLDLVPRVWTLDKNSSHVSSTQHLQRRENPTTVAVPGPPTVALSLLPIGQGTCSHFQG